MLMTSTNIFGQDESPDLNSQTPAVSEKIVSPVLESADRPSNVYRLSDIITYQIKIKWPELPEHARMSSPKMTLQNLELIGVSEETVSNPNKEINDSSIEQILTLRFKALKPGPAEINSLILEWVQGEGASVSSIRAPSVKLTVKSDKIVWMWPLFLGIILIVCAAFVFYFFKKKKTPAPVSNLSLEESYLNELNQTLSSLEFNSNHKTFLNELEKIFGHYLDQKLSWNRNQEDYNALQKKAEKKWDRREIQEIKTLFDQMEYCRFSGSELNRQELISLVNTVKSFIERKNGI